MDFRDVVFLAVAENLSFSKAAAELFISQPAVTKHIKELEAKLKVALFERHGNKVFLTESGNLSFNSLKEIKSRYDDFEYKLSRLNDAYKGNLRIGASPTVSQYLIPPVIAAFHKRYPKIKLFLNCGNSFEIEEKLMQNTIDIALVENKTSNSNIKYVNFLEEEIIVVTGNTSIYAKNTSLTIPDIQKIPMVLSEKGSGTLDVIQKCLNDCKIDTEKLNIIMHLGSTEAIKSFLTNFDGIALVSEKAVLKELQMKTIKKVHVKNLDIIRSFRMAFRQGPVSMTAELFRQFLLNYNYML